MAAQSGTLDAYLYGENLVDSGRSELPRRTRLFALKGRPACPRATPCRPNLPCLLLADAFFDSDHIRFLSKVVDKGPGWIRLERPLPYDLRTKWDVRSSGGGTVWRADWLCRAA